MTSQRSAELARLWIGARRACPTAGLAKVYQNLGAKGLVTRFTEKDLATVIQLERSKKALSG